MSKLQWVGVVVAVLLVAVTVVVARKRISPLAWGWYGPVHVDDGIAVGGFDPVAYFDGSAKMGDARFTLSHGGVKYRFASADNQRRFAENPGAFVPEFGGFCAFAASKGFTARTDPTAFAVEEGRATAATGRSVSGTSSAIGGHRSHDVGRVRCRAGGVRGCRARTPRR